MWILNPRAWATQLYLRCAYEAPGSLEFPLRRLAVQTSAGTLPRSRRPELVFLTYFHSASLPAYSRTGHRADCISCIHFERASIWECCSLLLLLLRIPHIMPAYEAPLIKSTPTPSDLILLPSAPLLFPQDSLSPTNLC